MKQTRLVFKNHLLPLLTQQFHFLRIFVAYQQPQLTKQKIKLLCQNIKIQPQKNRSFMKEIQKHNKLIVQENYRRLSAAQNFLSEVPFYYDILFKKISARKNLGENVKNSEMLPTVMNQATAVEKEQCRQIFQMQYEKHCGKFKKMKDMKIKHIPVLYFINAKELFQSENHQSKWEDTNQQIKQQYVVKYQQKLKQHNNRMNVICLQQNIKISKLASLIRNQQIGNFSQILEKYTITVQQKKMKKKQEVKSKKKLKKNDTKQTSN